MAEMSGSRIAQEDATEKAGLSSSENGKIIKRPTHKELVAAGLLSILEIRPAEQFEQPTNEVARDTAPSVLPDGDEPPPTKEFSRTAKKSQQFRAGKRVDLRLSGELFEQISISAHRRGIKFSEWARLATISYLDSFSKQLPPPFHALKNDKITCLYFSPELLERLDDSVKSSGLSRATWLKAVFLFSLDRENVKKIAPITLDN